MSISHLCIDCGFDLARVRARRDPHYALPLLICPDCGQAAVRRRHPIQRNWRALLHLKTALFALAVQLGMLIAGAVLVTATCVEAERWTQGNLIATPKEELVLAIILFGFLPIALGTWLTAGFGHLRRLPVWLAFSTLVALVLSMDGIGVPLARRLLDLCGFSLTLGELRWDEFRGRLTVLALIMILATAGIPLGLLIRAGHGRWRQARWRARRRRLRVRRIGR